VLKTAQIGCIALILSLTCAGSYADSISGNQYMSMSEKDRGWYFLGVLDAIKETRDTYLKSSEMTEIEFDTVWSECITGRPVRQHLAIVELWLKSNPTRWQEPAIGLIFDAERESCDALNKQDAES
jgi:hypothetical protein